MKMVRNKEQLRNAYQIIATQYADMVIVAIMLVVFGGVFINEIVGGAF